MYKVLIASRLLDTRNSVGDEAVGRARACRLGTRLSVGDAVTEAALLILHRFGAAGVVNYREVGVHLG